LLTRNAGAAIGPVNMLKGALLGLARFALIPIAIEIVVSGLAELDRLKKSLDDIAGFSSKEYQKQVKGLSKEEVNSRIIVNRRTQAAIVKEQKGYNIPILGALRGLFTGRDEELRARKGVVTTQAAVLTGAKGNLTQKQLDERRYGSTGTVAPMPEGVGGDSKKEKGKKERESQAAQLKLDLELSKEQFALDLQMINARLSENILEQNRLEAAKELLDLHYQIKGVRLEDIPEQEKQLKISKLEGDMNKVRLEANAKMQLALREETKAIEKNLKTASDGYRQEAIDQARYYQLLSEGINPELAKKFIAIENTFAEQKKLLDVQLKSAMAELNTAEATAQILKLKKDITPEGKANLQLTLDNIAALKEEIRQKQILAGQIPAQVTGAKDAATQLQAPAPLSATLQEGADAADKKLKDLADTGKLLVGTAGAIGDAFGNAFKGIMDGSMTAQQAFASLFQNVANYFTDMVAQMIAEWLKAQLIKGFMNIISMVIPGFGAAASVGGGFAGGASGFGGSFDAGIAPLPNIPNYSGAFTAANGGIAQGGFRAFASGGVVTGPTLGLVGEGRYNEAVIPLPDGKSVPVDLGGAGGSGQVISNIVVNVNSDGQSQSQQSGNGNAELGKKIEGAVKQVIVGELRPGGLLANRR
jgi:hypothetical protein